MVSVTFVNDLTQVNIDGYIYELPFHIDSIIHLSDLIIFHGDSENIKKPSLYCYKEKTNEIIWSMKDVISVFVEIPERKLEKDFISKEHFISYKNRFKGKILLSAYIGEFRKLIDATTGQIISSMEVR